MASSPPSEEWVLLTNNPMLGEPRVIRSLENIILQPPWSLLLLQPMKLRKRFSREPEAQMFNQQTTPFTQGRGEGGLRYWATHGEATGEQDYSWTR